MIASGLNAPMSSRSRLHHSSKGRGPFVLTKNGRCCYVDLQLSSVQLNPAMKIQTKNYSIGTFVNSSLLKLTIVGVLGVAPGIWAATISDNFDDGNDTAPTIAWQRYDPISDATSGSVVLGTWSFPGGNTYRLQTAASP